MTKKNAPHIEKTEKTEDQEIKSISSDTQIIFTVKSFITTIGTILGLFIGFYTMVISPNQKRLETMITTQSTEQKVQNSIFYQELGKINVSIGALSSSVNALNNSNKSNVNNNQSNTKNNTGGSLGGNTVASR
jgi:cell division protein FtsL